MSRSVLYAIIAAGLVFFLLCIVICGIAGEFFGEVISAKRTRGQ